jgi:transketolase
MALLKFPDNIKSEWDAKETGSNVNSEWDRLMDEYSKKHPELFGELERIINNDLPSDFKKNYEDFLEGLAVADQEEMATRKASEVCLNFFCEQLPELIGGSG